MSQRWIRSVGAADYIPSLKKSSLHTPPSSLRPHTTTALLQATKRTQIPSARTAAANIMYTNTIPVDSHSSSCPKCGAATNGNTKSCNSCGATCPN
ncbi:hypothetical protein MVEN_01439900 [Mycena venus]|uniref:Uncharacterized protein n=1 Tax=Mycena venus TaxID=2733690 RepID=A0A8H6XUX8_9AGAR|nr:hypothetical protein MVEN_01439900 [Mycena venus]